MRAQAETLVIPCYKYQLSKYRRSRNKISLHFNSTKYPANSKIPMNILNICMTKTSCLYLQVNWSNVDKYKVEQITIFLVTAAFKIY